MTDEDLVREANKLLQRAKTVTQADHERFLRQVVRAKRRRIVARRTR